MPFIFILFCITAGLFMEETEKECNLYHGTECLIQWGIFAVYLLEAKIPLLIMLVSLVGAIAYSPYFYLLFVFGFILPLAQADLRMYLYLLRLSQNSQGESRIAQKAILKEQCSGAFNKSKLCILGECMDWLR
jgi:hypothetical protein